MARSKTGLRGVGKPSGEVPAEPVGEFGPGEVDHPVIPAKAGIWLGRAKRRRSQLSLDDGYGPLRQRPQDIARCVHTGATMRR